MWGRITQIAERIDGTFAPTNDDDLADDDDDDAMEGADNDGWGDEDDLDDELDFGDDDDVDNDNGLDVDDDGQRDSNGEGDAWGEDDVAALEEDLRGLDEDDGDGDDGAVSDRLHEDRGFVTAAALLASTAGDKENDKEKVTVNEKDEENVDDVNDAFESGFGFDDDALDDLDLDLDEGAGAVDSPKPSRSNEGNDAVHDADEGEGHEAQKEVTEEESKTALEADELGDLDLDAGEDAHDANAMPTPIGETNEEIGVKPYAGAGQMSGETLEELIGDGTETAEAAEKDAWGDFDDKQEEAAEDILTQLDNNRAMQQQLQQQEEVTSPIHETKPASQLVPEPVPSTGASPISITNGATVTAAARVTDDPSATATATADAVTVNDTPAIPTSSKETQARKGAITVSAPGKALIAGGYLVLEQPNPGVVLAAKGCRFHSTVAIRPMAAEDKEMEDDGGGDGNANGNGNGIGNTNGNAGDATAPWKSIPVDIYSPQFHRIYRYTLWYSSLDYSPQRSAEGKAASPLATLRLQPRHADTSTSSSSSSSETKNTFVEKTVLLALGYLHQSLGGREFHERIRRFQRRAEEKESMASTEPLPQHIMALAIKLRADNDFYSQIHHLHQRGWELTPQNMELLEPFLPCPKEADSGRVAIHKTGLGSSAALVTSLVGALLAFFGVVSLPETVDGEEALEEDMTLPPAGFENGDSDEGVATPDGMENNGKHKEGLKIAHNLAQICHCYAQGKVGSGFDVSSAIYGSHIYTRFSRRLVGKFLDGLDQEGSSSSLTESVSQQLVDIVDGTWDSTVTPINLPPGLELLMADVCGGSESPSMAKQILEWKQNHRKTGFLDDYYWKDLKRCNKKIGTLLTDQFASAPIRDGLRRDGAMILANRTAEQWKKPMPSSWHEFVGSSWDVAGKLIDLRMAIMESRQNLKGMGRAAGVPVEPDEQTALANATMKLPGVVAAGVPGAGGYDALYVIYVKGPDTCDGKSDRVRDEIGKLWKEWNRKEEDGGNGNTKAVVCPLSVRAAGFGGENGLCVSRLDW